MGRHVGIDLGTTFSAIATIGQSGNPEIIKNAEGELLTPSVVYIGDSEIIVGKEAKQLQASGEERVASFFKRVMGNPNWVFSSGDKLYTAVDLSSFVLKKLKDDAESRLGEPVTHAVITVPAYFTDPQRRDTMDAARKAGIEVLRIINEPTAAALAYGIRQNKKALSTFLVYDLGGGTFDVSLVRMDKDNIEVIATAGNHELGGKDWDDAILRHVSVMFKEQHGVDPFDDTAAINDLLTRAETAKKALSASKETTFAISHQGRTHRLRISRREFEQLTSHLMELTVNLVEQVIGESGLRWDEIDEVLLVGGSTRMPMVTQFLTSRLGKPPLYGVDVDEAVALGAAIQADIDMRNRPGLPHDAPVRYSLSSSKTIKDVTGHSLGMVAISPDRSRYINSILISKNLPIPARQTRPYQFRTSASRTNRLEVYITQGESERPLDCTILGKYCFLNIPHDSNSGIAILDISYCYDQNSVVQVSAVDHKSGIELNYVVEPLPDDLSWLDQPPDKVMAGDHVSVLIAIDLSGSMSGDPLRKAQEAAKRNFVEKVDLTHTSIGLLAVADSVRVVQELCQDTKRMNEAIDSLEIGIVGGGNSGQPFTEARRLLKEKEGLRVLILLADGVWSYQETAIQEAKKCHEEKIEIVAIGFGTADHDFLREVASCDENALFTNLNDLTGSFDRIAQVLTERGLSFSPAGSGQGGSGLSVFSK